MNYNNIFNNSTFDDHNLTKSSLFHQNIRGINNKTDAQYGRLCNYGKEVKLSLYRPGQQGLSFAGS